MFDQIQTNSRQTGQGLANLAAQQNAREVERQRKRTAREVRLGQHEQLVQQRVRSFSCSGLFSRSKKGNGNGGPNVRPVVPAQASQSRAGASTSGRGQTQGQRPASLTRR